MKKEIENKEEIEKLIMRNKLTLQVKTLLEKRFII